MSRPLVKCKIDNAAGACQTELSDSISGIILQPRAVEFRVAQQDVSVHIEQRVDLDIKFLLFGEWVRMQCTNDETKLTRCSDGKNMLEALEPNKIRVRVEAGDNPIVAIETDAMRFVE